MQLPDCCLDKAFSGPLRARTLGFDELLPGRKHHLLLKSAYQGLPFNVAVENCFARIKSMQRSGRGRSDLSHTLCSKHLIAEIKKAYLDQLEHIRAHTDPVMSTSTVDDIIEGSIESIVLIVVLVVC